VSDAIGFVVVGLGMGRHRARMVAKTEGARLVGVADLRAELAQRVAEELGCEWHTDFRTFLDRPNVQVVWVMTPSGVHADVAVPALEAGKHVIVTKPMEVTLERADAMIAAAERNGRLLAVDFDMRFLKGAWQIRQAIADGMFGKLILLEGRLKWFRSQEYYSQSGWRGTWRYDGGGSLANQTIHLIDQLVWLGGEVAGVEAPASASSPTTLRRKIWAWRFCASATGRWGRCWGRQLAPATFTPSWKCTVKKAAPSWMSTGKCVGFSAMSRSRLLK